MFFLMSILIIALIVVWIIGYKMYDKFEQINDSRDNTSSSSSSIVEKSYYRSLELKLRMAGQSFGNKNDLQCYLDTCRIEYHEIKTNNLIEPLIDTYDNSECDGYVTVKENFYKAYIKCNNYVSEEY